MGEMTIAYRILDGKPEGKKPLERIGVDGRKVLERILGKLGGKMCTGHIWFRVGTSGGVF
jgi:hypothetical protein